MAGKGCGEEQRVLRNETAIWIFWHRREKGKNRLQGDAGKVRKKKQIRSHEWDSKKQDEIMCITKSDSNQYTYKHNKSIPINHDAIQKPFKQQHPHSLHPRAHYLSRQSIVLFVTLPILEIRQRLQDRHSAIRVQLPSKAMIQKKQRDLHSHLPSSLPHFESP